jgi:CRISPR system Cascade subunit CasB
MEVKPMSQTDQKIKKEELTNPFIQYLEENRDDRAMMASLRRGLAQPRCAEVGRIVQRRLSQDSPRWLEDAYYTIAPLFGLHHDEIASQGNMGDHFRALCDDPSDPPSNVERRFMQLLACDAADLDDLLRQAVSLLKSKEVAVNWHQLLGDVLAWKHNQDSRDKVRLRWSQRFWRTSRQPDRGDQPS